MPKIITLEMSDETATGLGQIARRRTDCESDVLRETTGDPDATAAPVTIEELILYMLDDLVARARMAGELPPMPSIDELIPF